MDKRIFEEKIQPILQYIGCIGAGITCIAYIIVVCVLIIGFQAHTSMQAIVFAIVNAVIGLIVLQFLKIQGISFAENLPENRQVVTEYYNTQTKDKKARSINYFWACSLIKDILIKGVSVVFSTAGIIYIVIEGSNDFNMLWLALVNLLLFVCFGLLSLNKAYDYYNNSHIPYIKEKLKETNKNDNV